MYRQEEVAFGAVGFVNEANDSSEQKRRIESKFKDDLTSALNCEPKPSVFVFFTNLNFSIGEKEGFVAEAKAAGITHCEIFDRERLRISFDSPDGFAIRFQYLGKPLSHEEQATFFAKWGDDIQAVVATGFQRIEQTLNRILFLQEVSDVLNNLHVHFELDREYTGAEIGHFRAFCMLHLKDATKGIFGVLFGSTDNAYRFYDDDCIRPEERPGIAHGIATGQWELRMPDEDKSQSKEATSKANMPHVHDEEDIYVKTGYSSGIGWETVKVLSASYNHGDQFIRFGRYLSLMDLDDTSIMSILNDSLARKLRAIHIYANGYKLQEISKDEFHLDTSDLAMDELPQFTSEELADRWTRIRPSNGNSNFSLSFYDMTPERIYSSRPIKNSLRK